MESVEGGRGVPDGAAAAPRVGGGLVRGAGRAAAAGGVVGRGAAGARAVGAALGLQRARRRRRPDRPRAAGFCSRRRRQAEPV